MNTADKDNFFNAVESLKKYRRADLVDEKGSNLLEKLYTDLLPSEHILKKCLKDNTTYLVGRKGTGKSTIFLRIEQELRKKDFYLPCYIDVKTVYESAQTEYINLDYLTEYLDPKSLQKYLIERSFLQSVLSRLLVEINLRYDTFFHNILDAISTTKSKKVKEKIEAIKNKIEDNEALKEIEIPIIKNIAFNKKKSNSTSKENQSQTGSDSKAGISEKGIDGSITLNNSFSKKEELNNTSEIETNFSSVYMQIFQIKTFIEEVKDVLKDLNIKHIIILLDDFSEIDDTAIETFVDVLLAPLNNWSEEFIKFKIAAYPNRIHYGKIDPGKTDIINLDFYNLYSEFERNKMEEGAIDFTKRLIEKRISYFTSKTSSDYFDTSRNTIEEYYELIFQTSMNVPRIIGYILSYCYQSKIIYDKKINKSDIESAAQKYYEDKIEPFFHKTTFSLMSINEKIDILQLKELLLKCTEKLTEVKRKITSSEYSGESYIANLPFSSHFHFVPELEKFLNTLELNYFISKYTEMSDKDGKLVSIYCINYGLGVKNNLMWGKPKGSKHRKYFIERPFNFNPSIKEFLASSKKTHCVNPECNQTFTQDQIPFLEFTNYTCNKCHGKVISESIADTIQNELKQIENKDLLPQTDINIIMELASQDKPLTAREIAEELDLSSQSIGQKNKMLDLKKGLIKRNKDINPFSYELTQLAKNMYK
ncbi:MarR family transcriptional regulator [Flavobacterium sp. EDS]|uniref:winged helix-turn-helix domain-containing protein n=1 Tax=Flavobacterium sp. EDS TaxID=2897328 RepID=UPI001E30FF3E|nr:winged helix-turn-helix domain-containing protein [Flavobacterium sp. EDS]MCD0473337.1 MarR family transcriptional regulator [Flavobacterium sp. EDS]